MIYCMMHLFRWSRFRSPCWFHVVLINLFLRCYRAPGAKHKIPLIRSRTITHQAFRKHVFFSVRCFLETKNCQYIPGTEPPTKITSKPHHSQDHFVSFIMRLSSLWNEHIYIYIYPLNLNGWKYFNVLFGNWPIFRGLCMVIFPNIPMFFFSQNSCNSGDHVAFVVSFWCQHQCFRSLCARVGFSHDRTPTLGMAWNFAGFKELER